MKNNLAHRFQTAYQFCINNSQRITAYAAVIAIFYHFILLAFLVYIGDVYIGTDIARDFLLLDELAQKGYVLVGPRSSAIGGIFHGPLWIYLSYPVYFISHANPIALSYLWMAWYAAFLLFCYIAISRLLRDRYIAIVSTALAATVSFEYVYKMINPFGAVTCMPFYLLTLYRTYTHKSWRWAILHLLVIGAMIQFQMAAGIPLLLVTFTIWFYKSYQDGYFKRFFSLPVLLLPLSTYILFEVRHNFSQTRSALNQLMGHDIYRISTPFYDVLVDRFNGLFQYGWKFLLGQYGALDVAALILFVIAHTVLYRKERKTEIERIFYLLSFVYGLFWFFSLLHNGVMLPYYYYPIMILPIVIIVISTTYINKLVAMVCLILALYVNSTVNVQALNDFTQKKGTDLSSWRFYEKLSNDIYFDAPSEFGYFIYSPDIVAYQAKWAMQYGALHHPDKKVARYSKRNTTYIIVEPPPKNVPTFTPDFWKIDKVKLDGKLITKWCYPNNYCVEKWSLTDAQVAIAPDPNIDDWLHYR